MQTVEQVLADGRAALSQYSPSPEIDARELVCYVLDCSVASLFTSSLQVLTTQQANDFQQLLHRRQQGEPIAYIVGSRGFWSLDLAVNASTLIPRPDTELLVELALTKITPNMTIMDLGTGTGAIALSIASERPDVRVFASDFSLDAVSLAQHNALNNGLHDVAFINMSWLTACRPQSIDMIISNPPYIRSDDPHLAQGDVRYEPASALVSGEDGLNDLRLIIQQSTVCLKPDGWLMVEHGFDQSESVQKLFAQEGFTQISAHQDLGGNDRVVIGRYGRYNN